MANNGEDDDDYDSDEDEDEGVLNHALAFLIFLLLANHELAQTQIQIVKHFRFHLLYPGIECRLMPRVVSRRPPNYDPRMFHRDGQSAKGS